MAYKQVNIFHKGIISDVEYLERGNDVWDFPTENLRIINKEGQGLILTNIEGDEEAFTITTGFRAIAARSVSGIIFIVSTNDNGIGEIGVYPSPVAWNENNDDFERTYKPLRNLIDPDTLQIGNLQTDHFNFFLDHPVDILLKESYDTSIDIYLADHNNPNLVINSGFKKTGQYLPSRAITHDHFNGAIHQVVTSKKIPIFTVSDVQGGGKLDPGNYFFFVRLLTESYARTPFFQHIGPVSVWDGTLMPTVNGKTEMDAFTGQPNYVGKKIILELNNLDPSFVYFEIACIRYSSLQEGSEASPVTFLLTEKFPIISDTVAHFITISGHESRSLISLDEILRDVPRYKSSKGHLEIDNVYAGYNWKRISNYDRDIFAQASALITIKAMASDAFPDDETLSIQDHADGKIESPYGFNDYEQVLGSAGYFHEQIYPFGIQYLLDEGWTEVFPIKGNIADGSKGLYKFPKWSDPESVDYTINGTSPLKKIRAMARFGAYTVNGTAAKFIYEHQSDFSSVRAVRFMRGNRIDNLIGQGVLLPMYDKVDIRIRSSNGFLVSLTSRGIGAPYGEYNSNSAYSVPLLLGSIPGAIYVNKPDHERKLFYHPMMEEQPWPNPYNYYWWDLNDHAPEDSIEIGYTGGGAGRVFSLWPRKRLYKAGIFCPDTLFELNPDIPSEVYIQLVHKLEIDQYIDDFVGIPIDYYGLAERMWPKLVGYDIKKEHYGAHNLDGSYIRVKSAFIDKGTSKGPLMSKSWIRPEDIRSEMIEGEGSVTARSYMTNRYISVHDQDDEESPTPINRLGEMHYGIVNIYKSANDVDFAQTVHDGFNVAVEFYKPITQTIDFLVGYNLNDIPLYHGDCFINKSFFRHGRWVDYHMANTPVEDSGNTESTNLMDKTYSGDGYAFVDGRRSTGSEVKYAARLWQYGAIIGIVTETNFNTYIRNIIKARDKDGNETYTTFFPKCVDVYSDYIQWLIVRDNATNESFQQNFGFNTIVPDITKIGIDVNLPKEIELEKPNRWYYSARHIPGAIFDGYRLILSNSYQDFNPSDGPITKGVNFNNILISIQENAIIRHYINERAVTKQEGAPDIIIGETGIFLSPNFTKVESFGSQHWFSVLKSDFGLYGVDWRKKIIWKAYPMTTQNGATIFMAKDISLEENISRKIQEIYNLYGKQADIVGNMPDDPLHGTGIITGYNADYKEAYFTFLFMAGAPGVIGRGDQTLVYSELIKAFVGSLGMQSPIYVLNENLLYSQGIEDGEIVTQKVPNGKFYLHDNGAPRCKFRGVQQGFTLTVIVNGLTAEGNFSKFIKIFEALRIDMNKEELNTIIYYTDTQQGSYTFKTKVSDPANRYWEHSEYNEDGWDIPVYIQTSVQGDVDFNAQSYMRGRYMRMTITFTPETEDQIIYIRSIITHFNISQQ